MRRWFNLDRLEALPDGSYRMKGKSPVTGLSDGKASISEPVNKYRNRKVEIEGVLWDSKKEYSRFKDLSFLQSIGKISWLERQVVFQLSVCRYIADFRYADKDGKVWVEDVKSAHTRKLPVYRLKKKLMKAELNIEIKEV